MMAGVAPRRSHDDDGTSVGLPPFTTMCKCEMGWDRAVENRGPLTLAVGRQSAKPQPGAKTFMGASSSSSSSPSSSSSSSSSSSWFLRLGHPSPSCLWLRLPSSLCRPSSLSTCPSRDVPPSRGGGSVERCVVCPPSSSAFVRPRDPRDEEDGRAALARSSRSHARGGTIGGSSMPLARDADVFVSHDRTLAPAPPRDHTACGRQALSRRSSAASRVARSPTPCTRPRARGSPRSVLK